MDDWKAVRRQILEERVATVQRANKDQGFRREVLLHCMDDSVYWCNNFAWTFDPRQEFFQNRNLAFILFPEQVEVVRFVERLLANKEDGLIEKSRDLGVSYTLLVPVILYRWLFHDFNARVGSRVESYVDKSDDPTSLFWKIDYNLRRLPVWMLPDGFVWDRHRTYMRLSRPDNQNVIIGESANENFARGGRENLILFDEHAFWPWGKSSWEAAGESTTTRLSVSTPPPMGRASFFYKLGISGRLKKLTFHYTKDPRKDKRWEDKQKEKKSKEEFERELNISYQGSLENTVYATEFKRCETGRFPYKPELPVYISWDFGLDGTAIQWYQWDRTYDKWFLVDSYFNINKDIGFFIPFINGDIQSDYDYDDFDLLKIQEHRKWRKDSTHFGDPDVKKRSYQTKGMISTREVLRASGIYVQSKPWTGKTHYDMRQKTILFLKKLSINDIDNVNEFFSDSIMLSRYPERSETNQATESIQKPIHNENSHHRTALEYMADNAPEPGLLNKFKRTYAKPKSIYER